jgi:hypothetical protein
MENLKSGVCYTIVYENGDREFMGRYGGQLKCSDFDKYKLPFLLTHTGSDELFHYFPERRVVRSNISGTWSNVCLTFPVEHFKTHSIQVIETNMISITDMIPGKRYMLVRPNADPEYLGKYDGLVKNMKPKWGGEFEHSSFHSFPERHEIRRNMGLPPIGWSDITLLSHIPDDSMFVELDS